MKNANGEGSVYKLKGKRRKPWIVVVTTGYNEEGRQKRKVLGTFTTKREAQIELIAYLNNPMLFSGKTFKDVVNLWYCNYSKKISKGRLIIVNSLLKKLEAFSEIKIKDLKLHILQEFFDNFSFSSGTKTNLKSVLNMIFEFALKNDFIDVNKVKFIELGKFKKVVDRKIFTKDEIEILCNNLNSNAKSKKLVYIILILIYTGLRIGELLKLKIEDINLLNKTINIKESKTNAGLRTIPIPDKIVYLFEENIKINKVYFLETSKNKQEKYTNILYNFNKLMESLNMEHTIHDTRHTFATMLNNADVNSTSIIKLIGHSNFTTTENIYTHKDVEELRKAINLLN